MRSYFLWMTDYEQQREDIIDSPIQLLKRLLRDIYDFQSKLSKYSDNSQAYASNDVLLSTFLHLSDRALHNLDKFSWIFINFNQYLTFFNQYLKKCQYMATFLQYLTTFSILVEKSKLFALHFRISLRIVCDLYAIKCAILLSNKFPHRSK